MVLGLVLSVTLQAGVQAAAPAPPLELAPGTRYDPRVPTLQQVAGHDFGEEITPPDQIVAYLKALAAAVPDRATLIEYARSWEGRPLHVIAIGAPARMAQLDEVKAGLRRLADPRGLAPAAADRLVESLPVVVWLMHAVHGNEVSSSDAALAQAYHLLAARNDPVADAILSGAIVLIDPLQNPDGRARFVSQYQLARAAAPDAEPASAEHVEPWPSGRSNHYLFDMNRDWFAQSQPETRGRTALYLDWFPHVVVDLHEMGGDSTYYFAPPADPLNPHITTAQAAWFDTFGRENGRRFDERGFAYFTREVYDSFYPGYGESWPIFHGAIGMTYEQASARGLVWRRSDETTLTYRDGVVRHFTAAMTTARTAAVNRARVLRDFLEFRRSAVEEGERGPVREYLLPPGRDRARTARLVSLLEAQGFDVRRAEAPFKAAGRDFPAGTWIVPAAQPAGRLVRNLLDAHTPQPEAFVKEQDRRRRKRLSDQIYDVTAWSLPLAIDVEVVPLATAAPVASAPRAATPGAAAVVPSPGTVGYVAPWGTGTAALAAPALQAGARLRTSDLPFRLAGRDYPPGALIVRASENTADALALVGRLAAQHDVDLVPIDSSFTEAGSSLGSDTVVALKAPRVLLAWDAPAQSLSAGWARFALERRFGQPATIVRLRSLGRIDLGRYDVLVLPEGQYGDAIGADAIRRVKDWVSAGGTLVALGEASRWAARENVGLLDTHTELRDGRPESDPSQEVGRRDVGDASRRPQAAEAGAAAREAADAASARKAFDLEAAIQPDRERPEATPGAMLRVTLDLEHWLSAGTDGEIQAIVDGQRVFTPIKLDKGRNVGLYAARDRLVASGLAWEEARQQLALKAFLIHQPTGRGHVIAFAEDPNFRAFTEATTLLFINAVLLGPAH
jgi:hypothetical protein